MSNANQLENQMRTASGSRKKSGKDTFKNKIHLKFGAIAGGILIIHHLLFYFLGWYFDKDFKTWIPYVLFMLLIVAAQFQHVRTIKEQISFGNLFAKGFKTAAVATCIYILFLILFILLDPTYKKDTIDFMKTNITNQGLEGNALKSALENIKKIKASFLPYNISTAVFGKLIFGIIASLAGAAASSRNKKPELKSLS